jgi:hypothetical protein
MSDKDKKDIEPEVQPLTDEDLESVPGGAAGKVTDCSCTETGGNCTSSSATGLNPE